MLEEFTRQQENNIEHYWSLLIEQGWVQAGIWRIEKDNKAQIISQSLPAHWDTNENLIDSVDICLSAAIQSLPEDINEPSKTVFGFPPSWIAGGEIKKEYLDNIRLICSKLSLEPSGFVVIPEAIAHFIKSEEGSPLTAVIIGLSRETIDVTLFKFGNLLGTSSVARSVSVVDDVVEGLARFNTQSDPLPSRFLIYDGKEGELEEAKQTLISADWNLDSNKNIRLLHIPKVEIIETDKKVLAVSLAGASEIAGVTKIFIKEEESNITLVKPEEVGFVVEKEESLEEKFSGPEAFKDEQKPQTSLVGKINKFKSKFVKLNIKPKVTKPVILSGKRTSKYLLPGFALLVSVLIISFIAWWFLPKATVTIYVSPKHISGKSGISINTGISDSDLGKNILKGKIYTSNVSGDKTANATGTKTVGDKAKGVVVIRNGSATNINLNSGAILTGPDDLRFSLDSSASVSAALSPSDPGTVNINVTAAGIGAQYNLAKDEVLKVGNYSKSEVDALIKDNFSGGTSHDISAVSSDDRKFLEQDLLAEILENGKKEINSKISPDETLINETIEATPSAEKFSAKVGDEASTLKLTLSLDVKTIAVETSILRALGAQILKDNVPEGLILRDNNINFNFNLKSKKDNLFLLDINLDADLLPAVKAEEIKKLIAGKYPNIAESYLTSIPGFSRAVVHMNPSLPSKLGIIPHITKNIELVISAEK